MPKQVTATPAASEPTVVVERRREPGQPSIGRDTDTDPRLLAVEKKIASYLHLTAVDRPGSIAASIGESLDDVVLVLNSSEKFERRGPGWFRLAG